jgi:hypothetical protein
LKIYFIRKRLDFVIYQTEKEYYTILGFTDISRKFININIPVNNPENIENLEKILEDLSFRRRKATRS